MNSGYRSSVNASRRRGPVCIGVLALITSATVLPGAQALEEPPKPPPVVGEERQQIPEETTQEPRGADQAQESDVEAVEIEEQEVQEELQEKTLEEVVITATRRSQRPFDSAYTVHSLSADDLNRALTRTTPEALRELPGIMVQKTGHGQGSPYIRGFTSFRNLFLIDGIRLNNSVFRSGPNQYWNTVDSLSLSRIEIVKGPTSVLYGSDAIGGTVNAITKSPTIYGEGVQTERRLYYRFSSAERSHIYRFEAEMTFDDKLGLLIGGSMKDFGSLHAGRGTGKQSNTGYEEWDLDFKAEYFFNPDTRLVIAHQFVQQNNAPRTHRTIYGKSFDGTTLGRDRRRDLDQERTLTYVQLHAENMDSFVKTMRLSLSWQEQHETRDRVRRNGRQDFQGFDVGTLGMSAQFESPTPVGYLTYGIEYYHDHVNSFSTRNRIQGPVADNARYDLLGIYIQDEFAVTDRLDLILGGRINFAHAGASRVRDPRRGTQFSMGDEWWSFLGSFRFVYHVIPEHINVFGGVSQGFRAPNLSDLTRFDTARTDELEVPVFGLDPETYISYEVGVKAEYDKWAAQAAYFYTAINDMIIRVPTGNAVGDDFEVTKVNAGDGFVHGVEVSASYRLHPQWTFFGDFTWIDGEVEAFPTSYPFSRREPIGRLMPVTGHAGLRWSHPSGKAWIEGITTIAGLADSLSSRDKADTSRIPPGGTPSYTVFSLRSGWEVNDNVSLTVALENLTDENYRIHGSGLNEPGRSLNIGVNIKF